MLIIVVFGDISLNTVKRLQCILKTVITLDHVKHHKCGIDDIRRGENDICHCVNLTISKECQVDPLYKDKYLDMYHTILIKLAFKQLILTPLNRMSSYQSIKSLLEQVYPSYDHFIKVRDDHDDISFIECQHWYYFSNEIRWFEFLSGRISKVSKFGELAK